MHIYSIPFLYCSHSINTNFRCVLLFFHVCFYVYFIASISVQFICSYGSSLHQSEDDPEIEDKIKHHYHHHYRCQHGHSCPHETNTIVLIIISGIRWANSLLSSTIIGRASLFGSVIHSCINGRMNNITKITSLSNNVYRGMEFASPDVRDDEHNGIGFAQISGTFMIKDSFC